MAARSSFPAPSIPPRRLRPAWGSSHLDEGMRRFHIPNTAVAEWLGVEEHTVRRLREGSRALTAEKLRDLREPLKAFVLDRISRGSG
jgi:hypothetical protein